MTKIIKCFLALFFCTTSLSFAQKKFSDNLFFGGNVGLQFGSVTIIEVSPLVGYHITPRLSTGVGAKYQYYKVNRTLEDYSASIYGGRIFANYILLQEIPLGVSGKLFAHSEYEILSLEKKHFKSPFIENGRFLLHSVLVGGGYNQQISERASVNFMVLWNLNEYEYSPYASPIIRIGISIN